MRALRPLALLLVLAIPAIADWAEELRAFNAAFRSDFPENRITAVRALKNADHPEGAKMLLSRFLSEKDPRVQTAIAEALADLGSDKSRMTIRTALLTESDDRRRASLCGILRDGHNLDRVDILKAFLADRSERVRIAACGVICPSDVSILPLVARTGSSGSAEVRAAAMEALGRANSLEGVPLLIEALEKDADPIVKKAAIASLVRMSDRNWGEQIEMWKEWWLRQRAKDMSPVDRAIFFGAWNLKPQLASILNIPGARERPLDGPAYRADQIVPLLTYALFHAGVPAEDPVMVAAVAFMKSTPLSYNYSASIQALVLADMDPRAHVGRLSEIAQWLADTQCENGQWSYGQPSPFAQSAGQPVQTGGRQRVVMRDVPRSKEGDGSNTQFAVLALRAAFDAGIEMPAILWERTLDWYVKHEGKNDAQAWRRLPNGGIEKVEASGKPSGWGYGLGRDTAYHSMTCSGICAVTICLRALGRDAAFREGRPDLEPMIGRGLEWLRMYYENRRGIAALPYYDLYSIERVGMILSLDRIGDRDWYQEGVDVLLPRQLPNGSWGDQAVDTCFAILFLRRATHGYPSEPKEK